MPLITPCPHGGTLIPVLPSDAPPRTDQTTDITSMLHMILTAPHTALDTAAAWRAHVLGTHCRAAMRTLLAPQQDAPVEQCHPAHHPLGKPPWIPSGVAGKVVVVRGEGDGDGTHMQVSNTTPLNALQLAGVQDLCTAIAVLLADVVRLVCCWFAKGLPCKGVLCAFLPNTHTQTQLSTHHAQAAHLVMQLWNTYTHLIDIQHGVTTVLVCNVWCIKNVHVVDVLL